MDKAFGSQVSSSDMKDPRPETPKYITIIILRYDRRTSRQRARLARPGQHHNKRYYNSMSHLICLRKHRCLIKGYGIREWRRALEVRHTHGRPPVVAKTAHLQGWALSNYQKTHQHRDVPLNSTEIFSSSKSLLKKSDTNGMKFIINIST